MGVCQYNIHASTRRLRAWMRLRRLCLVLGSPVTLPMSPLMLCTHPLSHPPITVEEVALCPFDKSGGWCVGSKSKPSTAGKKPKGGDDRKRVCLPAGRLDVDVHIVIRVSSLKLQIAGLGLGFADSRYRVSDLAFRASVWEFWIEGFRVEIERLMVSGLEREIVGFQG
jgi:hypothetical protein